LDGADNVHDNSAMWAHDFFRRIWQSRGWTACLLWPLSQLFGVLVRLRRSLYALGVFSSTRLPVPVWVVGNVCVGGGGKSPTVIALVHHLKRRGLRVAIVSRGFGRSKDAVQTVHAGSPVGEVGDEPLLLAQRTGVPVYVAAQRVRAAQAACEADPHLDVIVADDGLQHLALQRDVEVLVWSPLSHGNGWLLPAGPLREPWPRKADLVLDTRACRGLEGTLISKKGEVTPLRACVGQPVVAVAGIAQPQVFFDMLREQGVTLVQTLVLPDHDDFSGWPQMHATLPEGARVLCTEKDAAKLWPQEPQALAVPMRLEPDDAFFARVDALLAQNTR
jgi:tetraacyldisaccharide 4'-kinase